MRAGHLVKLPTDEKWFRSSSMPPLMKHTKLITLSLLYTGFALAAFCILLPPLPVSAASVLSIPGNSTAYLGLSGSSYDSAIAERYTPTLLSRVCTISIPLASVGTPSDKLTLQLLEATSSVSSPGSGRLIFAMDATISSSALTTYSFVYQPCVDLQPGFWYYIALHRSGSADGSNYYAYSMNTAHVSGYGEKWRYNTVACGGWCTVAQDVAFSLDNDIAAATGNEQIILRTPSSSVAIPNPTSYIVSMYGLNAQKSYYIKVSALQTSSTVSSTEVGTTFNSWAQFGAGASSSSKFNIAMAGNLAPGAVGDRMWTITANLCSDGQCTIVYSSSTRYVTTNGNASIPNDPYASDVGGWESPDDFLFLDNGKKVTREYIANNLVVCGAAPDWTDWGGGLWYAGCKTIQLLFIPHETTEGFLSDAATRMTKIYPLKFFYDAAAAGKIAAASGGSADLEASVDFSSVMANGKKVVLLSSSTLANIATPAQKSAIFETEGYVIWAVTLGFIIMTTL